MAKAQASKHFMGQRWPQLRRFLQSFSQRVVHALEQTSAQWWPQSSNLLHLDMHLAAICSLVELHSLRILAFLGCAGHTGHSKSIISGHSLAKMQTSEHIFGHMCPHARCV